MNFWRFFQVKLRIDQKIPGGLELLQGMEGKIFQIKMMRRGGKEDLDAQETYSLIYSNLCIICQTNQFFALPPFFLLYIAKKIRFSLPTFTDSLISRRSGAFSVFWEVRTNQQSQIIKYHKHRSGSAENWLVW